MNITFFTLGMVAFTLAQLIRATRWQLLLPNDISASKRRLFLYVSTASLFNAILPFHIGDILRALMLSKKENIRISFGLASLVIERLTDALIVLIVALIFYLYIGVSFLTSYMIVFLLASCVCVCFFIKFSKSFRRLVYKVTSIWNIAIQIAILDFFWSVVTQLNHARFLSSNYILMTTAMWGTYSLSYTLFSLSLSDGSILNTWVLFHGNPLEGRLLAIFDSFPQEVLIAFSIFLLAPIFLVFLFEAISLVIAKFDFSEKFLGKLSTSTSLYSQGIRWAFSGKSAYENFLISHFSGKISSLNKLCEYGFDDCKISRFFSGGSQAHTAVVEVDGALRIRKVVDSTHSSRLLEQYNWLKKNCLTSLPLVKVSNFCNTNRFSYYEMPYELGVVDMYEWLHTVSFERAEYLMTDVINSISSHHNQFRLGANDELKSQYLIDKVLPNLSFVKQTMARLIDINDFNINGERFSISEWSYLEDLDLLSRYLEDTIQTDIHGDFTIENMIVRDDLTWMLIDPNPSYMYKTALMDWGKLFQSLHEGYESLNKNPFCEIDQKNINFFISRSDCYHKLYILMRNSLLTRFGASGLREAMLHEIIHYLRLLPYKFAKSEEAGVLFFAITCKIVREFRKAYVDN